MRVVTANLYRGLERFTFRVSTGYYTIQRLTLVKKFYLEEMVALTLEVYASMQGHLLIGGPIQTVARFLEDIL